jgi:hypothetical protein
MRVGTRIGRVVQANDFDAGVFAAAQPATHEIATNPAKSIDRNTQSHGNRGQTR